jgi:hypothetical protein
MPDEPTSRFPARVCPAYLSGKTRVKINVGLEQAVGFIHRCA